MLVLMLAACSLLERDPVPPEAWCHSSSGTVEVIAVNAVEGSDDREVEYTVGSNEDKPLGGFLAKRYTAPLGAFKEAADLGACK